MPDELVLALEEAHPGLAAPPPSRLVEGDGQQTRDFIFVKDTTAAILQLADREDGTGEVLNLGSGRETTIEEIVRTVADDALGSPLKGRIFIRSAVNSSKASP